MTRELPAATQRFSTIDFLRGLSILAVVLLHLWLRFTFAGYNIRKLMPHGLIHLFFSNGGNGVTVFFAVSGFLITLTSLGRFGSLRRMQPRLFYRIRFARIAPLLMLVVAVLSGLALLHIGGYDFGPKRVPLWRAVLAVLTFHSNWLEARYGYLPACWNVMWSLSVEEMFYLFFPLLCVAALRLRRGAWIFAAVLLGFVCMGPLARTVWAHGNDVWSEQSYLGGMDGIALGCLAALLLNRLLLRDGGRWAERHRPLLLAVQVAGAVVLGLIAVGPRWIWLPVLGRAGLWETILSLGTCLVMLASVLRGEGRSAAGGLMRRLTAPVRWYGRHSYEVYLTHEFLVIEGVKVFLRFHPNPAGGPSPHPVPLPTLALWFAAILLLTAPLGWVVARCVSEPMNRRLRGARLPSEA